MTPQLQQAIRLLQLSTLDLQQEIHQALESNPMLEMVEDEDEGVLDTEAINEKLASTQPTTEQENASFNGDESSWQDQIPNDLSVDSNWDDIYPNSYTSSTSPAYDSDPMEFESRSTAVDTLQDHLTWQLNLTHMSDIDREIAVAIIDAIDPNGMLTVGLESLQSGLNPEFEIEIDEILAVLHRIQHFDPIGVGYRDLSECLLIQLQHLEGHPEHQAIENAKVIIRDYISLLGNRDYAQLMRRTKIKEPDLRAAIAIIENLDPRPGSNISPTAASYVVPDVIVTKQSEGGKWKVELNPETAPKIRINNS